MNLQRVIIRILCNCFIGIAFLANAQVDKASYRTFIKNHPFRTKPRLHSDSIKKMDKKDRPDLAEEQNFLMTLDPKLGYPPRERLTPVIKQLKKKNTHSRGLPGGVSSPWEERGPNNVGGRTRALMFDPNDVTEKKVWAGGVTGGLWYNNDITNSNSNWQSVDDFWNNIAISCIAFDPNNTQTFYVGTGEVYTGASKGAGIWKSTDGGQNWTQLISTNNFYYVNDIIVRNENGASVIYAGIDGRYYQGQWHGVSSVGLQRSTDGGQTWTQVLPVVSSGPYSPSDIKLASDNRIWIGSRRNPYGEGAGTILHSDDGLNWSISHTQSGAGRVALACAPSDADYLYCLIEYGQQLGYVLKSTDKGVSWVNLNEPDASASGLDSDDFTRNQAWYDLVIAVDPLDKNSVIIGGIDLFKSTDAGISWNRLSYWHIFYGSPYVHADQHAIIYKNNSSSEAIFGNDGGVFYSNNLQSASPSFQACNTGYNVTQFYSAAMHPSANTDYYLAGSQDNGSHQFSSSGINSTIEVTGGDGAFCFIDQLDPNLQLTSYVYNSYRRSTNGGSSFSSIQDNQSTGMFINPCAYDSDLKILYSSRTSNTIQRISGIDAVTSIDYFTVNGMQNMASSFKVSPYTSGSTTLFIGTSGGDVYKITNANSASPLANLISNGIPAGNVSSIDLGDSEDKILLTLSNFGINSVWYSDNGGSSWSNKEGNLPDMPIRWGIFNPNNYNEVLLATELGIWATDNFLSASPTWQASNAGFANVRVDMLKIRNSDYQVCAATHGRGLFTNNGFFEAGVANDAGISMIIEPVAEFICDSVINPIILLKNHGDSVLSNVEIKYSINGGALQTTVWNGFLGLKGTDSIFMPPISLALGLSHINIYTNLPNGQADENNNNDSISFNINYVETANIPYLEDFESGIYPPLYWGIEDPGGTLTWSPSNGIIGSDGNTTTASFMNNYSYSSYGAEDGLLIHKVDLTNGQSPFLTFDLAYGRWSNVYFDALKVLVSDDCGENFQQLYFKSGSDLYGNNLSTVGNQNNAFFPSSSSHWRNDTISLAAYTGKSILIKFVNIAGYGNNLFIDNVHIRDVNSCSQKNNFSKSDASCNASNGSIISKASMGNPPYSFAWSNTSTDSIIENLNSGWDYLTITDSSQCLLKDSIEVINQNFEISLDYSTSPKCKGELNGTIALLKSGGSPSYNYSWSNGDTDSILTAGAGIYSVSVSDQNGCTTTDSFIIIDATPIIVNASTTNLTCFESNDGSISTSISNGTAPYTYLWSNSESSSNIAFLAAGNYQLTITDSNQCIKLDSFIVTEPDSLSLSSIKVNDSCALQKGSIEVIVQGGTQAYTYSWSNGANANNLNLLNVGQYSVTVTDANNCLATASYSIDTLGFTNFSLNKQDNYCFNGKDGWIKTNITQGSPPYQYSWSNGSSLDSIMQLRAGSYTLSLLDSYGCESIQSINIDDPPKWTITYDSTWASCGINNGSAQITTVNNSTPPLTYNWSDGQIGANALNLYAGTYQVTVSDSLTCLDSFQIIINNYEPFVSTSSKANPSCIGLNDGHLGLDISGGESPYQIIWNTGNTQDSIGNLLTGIYRVTVMDNSGCVKIYEDTLSSPDSIEINYSFTTPKCFDSYDGNIIANASSGNPPYTYLWSNGHTDSSNINIAAGIHTVSVSDSKGCQSIRDIYLAPVDSITSNAVISNAYCDQNNGSVIIAASGGEGPYSYLWYNNATDSSLFNLASASYSLTITDNINCSNTFVYSISNVNGPSLSLNYLNPSCHGTKDGLITSTVNGGTSPYQYLWSTSDQTAGINNLDTGIYYLSVTDQKNCLVIDSVHITQADALDIDIITTLASCNTPDGSAQAQVNGGVFPYYYAWSTNSAAPNIFGLSAANYSITVTDNKGCTENKDFNIVNPLPNVNASTLQIQCHDSQNGKISINANGGNTPYSYVWNTGDTSSSLSNLSPGFYTVTVTDASGCLSVYSDSLSNPSPINLSLNGTDIGCYGNQDGQINSTLNGGVLPFQYIWSNSETTDSIANLNPGTYSLTVIDQDSCIASGTDTIYEPDLIQIIANIKEDYCHTDSGQIITSIFGGTSPYQYQWSNGFTSSSLQNLSRGNYILTITDANACVQNDSFWVDTAALIQLQLSSNTSLCDSATGSIESQIFFGQGPYQYFWSNGSTDSNLNQLNVGTYYLTVKDIHNCSASAQSNIEADLNYSSNFSLDTSICLGDTLFGAFTNIDSFNSSNESINKISDLSFWLYETESSNYVINLYHGQCIKVDSFKLNILPQAIANITSQLDSLTYGESTILEGNQSSSYLWTSQNAISDSSLQSIEVSITENTSYFLTIVDSNGCIASDSILLLYKEPLVELIPMSGISPNGDGKNDTWHIGNIELFEKAEVSIYSKDGYLVFKQSNYNDSWDGTNQGKELNEGVYYYIIDFKDGTKALTGHITLFR